MSYYSVMSSSNNIRRLAGNGESHIRELSSMLNLVTNNWQGESGGAFLNNCMQLQRDVSELTNLLQSISGNLAMLASQIKQAEENAKMSSYSTSTNNSVNKSTASSSPSSSSKGTGTRSATDVPMGSHPSKPAPTPSKPTSTPSKPAPTPSKPTSAPSKSNPTPSKSTKK